MKEKKKVNWIKVLGWGSTIIGAILTLVDGFVEDKELETKVQEEVQKQLYGSDD